jgi:hypothetical protein
VNTEFFLLLFLETSLRFSYLLTAVTIELSLVLVSILEPG